MVGLSKDFVLALKFPKDEEYKNLNDEDRNI